MDLTYVCPRCRAAVALEQQAYRCTACDERYPIVCGIPDFRVFADPYIGLEEDREKAAKLFERSKQLDFQALVRHYFDITPEVPPPLAQRYMQWMFEAGPVRARTCLEQVEQETGQYEASTRVLELGSGAGPFLPTLRSRFKQVTAVDIALRWLVITRKRLQELGHSDVQLVCACAEHLPFASNQFDLTF